MSARVLPRYPVYIPTKGRWQRTQSKTVNRLTKDGVPFYLVVEPQECEAYEAIVGEHGTILELPFSNLGQGSIPARNWIKERSLARGDARHWQLDDNIIEFRRLWRGDRIPCAAGVALRAVDDFADRYENVAIAGLNYQMFTPLTTRVPFYLNVHVYSCTLILNALPHRWRGRYNEDTDISLQVLADGWCTVLVNVFMANKTPTMSMRGGNTDDLYQGDGRLRMARELEERWPGIVTVDRRWGHAQHVIDWSRFKTPLKPCVDLATLPERDEYGLELHTVRDVKDEGLKRIATEYAEHDPQLRPKEPKRTAVKHEQMTMGGQ